MAVTPEQIESLSERQREFYDWLAGTEGFQSQAEIIRNLNSDQRSSSNVLNRLLEQGLVTYKVEGPEWDVNSHLWAAKR